MDRVLALVIDDSLAEAYANAFEEIDEAALAEGVAPSEIRRYLDRNYGLGEIWEDWWRESGEDWR